MFKTLLQDRDTILQKYHDPGKEFDPFNRMAYHGYEYDAATGLDDEEMDQGLLELGKELPRWRVQRGSGSPDAHRHLRVHRRELLHRQRPAVRSGRRGLRRTDRHHRGHPAGEVQGRRHGGRYRTEPANHRVYNVPSVLDF